MKSHCYDNLNIIKNNFEVCLSLLFSIHIHIFLIIDTSMSVPELNTAINLKDESLYSANMIKQEDPNHSVNMDLVKKETVTPGPLTIAKSKEIVCIDMENSVEPQVDINNQVVKEPLVNLSELTAHVISERAARRKLSVKALCQYMLGHGRQPPVSRQIWDRGQPPQQPSLQPEQAVWMQYGPSQIQVPFQSPFQGPQKEQEPPPVPGYTPGPGHPPGPQITQAQYPQGPGQGYYQGPPQRYGPPQGQGYYQGPPQGQGYYQGPPQGQGYYQGPPQGQGYYQGPPQQQGYYQGPGQGGPPPHHMRGFIPSTGTRLEYDPKSRNGFVRLVMSIVFIMLLVTAGLVAFVLVTPNLKLWFRLASWEVLVPSILCLMTANYGLICSPCSRVCPGSFICLTLAVIGMALLCAKVTTHYRTTIILYAIIATAAVVMVCVGLAFTSFDFTSYALYIVGASVAFSVIVMIIFIASALTGTMMKPVFIVILLVGTLIQVVVLSMELQMVLGGRAIEISEDDYALAAYMIYTSILDIFIKMVQLLGLLDG